LALTCLAAIEAKPTGLSTGRLLCLFLGLFFRVFLGSSPVSLPFGAEMLSFRYV
jgi:hypothetical protein